MVDTDTSAYNDAGGSHGARGADGMRWHVSCVESAEGTCDGGKRVSRRITSALATPAATPDTGDYGVSVGEEVVGPPWCNERRGEGG